MSSQLEVLQALFGANAVEEFLSDCWPDGIYVANGAKDRLPAALLDEDLNEFQALSHRYKGVVSFFGDGRSGHMVPVEGIDAAAPYHCGLSVYLSDISPYFPDVERMTRELELELGVNEGCARAGVFASPSSGGISCHYDNVDVFCIQLRGTKRFELAPVKEIRYPWGSQFVRDSRPIDDLYPQATEGFPDSESAEFQAVEMKPGTVLYMPKGTWHRTEAGDDSISVNIGLSVPTAADCVLEQLRLLMLQDPEWRRSLYGAWGTGAMKEDAIARIAGLMAKLPELASLLDAELATMPNMSEMRRISRMDADSRVQHTPHTTLKIGDPPAGTDEEDSILASVETADRGARTITSEIEMPSRCAPVLRWIDEQRGSFRISDVVEKFPELTEDQHLQVIQTLAGAGLLKTYWFPKL